VENGIFELLQVMLATKPLGSRLGAHEDAAGEDRDPGRSAD
jgi:hypothetical protein